MTRSDTSVMVGDSEAMAQVRRQAALAARGAASVLIEGETGTGKELVAALIHRASGRTGRLVAVNMAAIPDALFESAVFGHRRGAFTGAVRDEPGHVRAAHGGTLFLDEISSLSLEGQAKLLRVLETGRVMTIGASSEVAIDFRVVAASNADLDLQVQRGKFRADLYYRLCEWRIAVPALRHRLGDIEALAHHFLAEWTAGASALDITDGALAALRKGDWPGNVRQLRQTIRRAAILAEGNAISTSIVRDAMANGSRASADVGADSRRSGEVRELVATLNDVEWDIAVAALRLAVTKKTVYARLQKYNIAIPDRYGRRNNIGADLRSD